MIVNKRKERSRCSLRRRVELPTSSPRPFPPFNSKSIWTLKKDHRTGHTAERTNKEKARGGGKTEKKKEKNVGRGEEKEREREESGENREKEV